MQDKIMVNDTLSAIKNSLATYANAISECENTELKTAFKQIRNQCEMSHEELFNLAHSKGFYQPAAPAQENEIQQVKSQLQG